MDLSDEEIVDLCYRKDGRINPNIFRKGYINTIVQGLEDYLRTRYTDIPEDMFSMREVLWRLKYGIEQRPVCPVCGKPVKFHGKESHLKIHKDAVKGYVTCCSIKCASNYEVIKNRRNQTNIEKYGVDNPRKSKELMKRMRDKYEEKTGYRFASQNPEIKKKIKETNKKKYGYEHPMQNRAYQKRIRESNMKKYGTPYAYRKPKTEEEKRLITEKQQATYRRNRTYNTSKHEGIIERMLKEKFGEKDIMVQYSSEMYPHKCDYYIKSLDLYFEYQGGCFHNNRPYDPEIDKESLEWLREKKSKTDKPNRYDYIILEWTQLDVKKREDAKNNHLNYLELFPHWEIGWLSFCAEFEGRKHSQYYVERYYEFRDELYDLIMKEFKNVNDKQLVVGTKLKSWYEETR